jgi:ABC-type oligopeptide transport system substrate-binding subunit
VHEDVSSSTLWALTAHSLWVGSADDLVKLDTRLGDTGGLGREAARFKLDDLGEGVGLAEGVALGGGSVWVSRDVGRGQILRLEPATGQPEHVWNDITPYLNLAYDDGSLWAADERGLVRIDAETNLLTRVSGIRGNCGGGEGCLAAGGGFGWTTDLASGTLYKVDEAGQIAATYNTGIGSGYMAYSNGVLWVRNFDEGTVTGIDAVTGTETATYRFGHPVVEVAAGDGVLLAHLLPGPTVEDRIDALGDNAPKLLAHANELPGDEPALNVDEGGYQIEFATCAKLLNYPDEPPPQGLRLRPEVAAAMPKVSPDGRTYTFKVRPGYRFSPPSNQLVTAQTFRASIERALSPRLAENPISQIPPGPRIIDDIEGERAFRAGAAGHISGLRASGDTLSITLTKPSPDFLERLALPFFCPEPKGTPTVAGAERRFRPDGSWYAPSTGPYYIANYGRLNVILKRNPNYRGPRPQALDAIAIREGVDAGPALELVEDQGWDGITSLSDPVLDPGRAVDRQWGAGSAAAASGDRRYFSTPEARTRYIAFNARRGVFADRQVRRAAALALDRTALAAASNDLPTDQLLSGALPGYQDKDLYPAQPSVATAAAVREGRGGRAVMPVPSGCGQCTEAARVVRADLAAIGIEVKIREREDFRAALEPGGGFDLLEAETRIPYPDSASFLAQMMRDIPPGWAPAATRAKVQRVARLTGGRRQRAAAALADRLATGDVPLAAYGAPQFSQFIGPRIGCRVFTPVGYGLDLAALCVN